MNRYLLFTALTGFLESGVVLLALQQWPDTLWLPALFGLSYQLGALLANRIPSPCLVLFASDCGFVVLAAHLGFPVLLFPVVIAISWRIQQARDANNVPTPVYKKRVFRVAGFLGSALVLVPFVPVVAWVVISVLLLLSRATTAQESEISPSKQTWSLWSFVMLTHQLHYFTYVYGIFWVLHAQGNVALPWLSVAFAAGWVPYLLIEPLIKTHRHRLVLISGHLFLVFVLVLLAAGVLSSLSLLLWLATGLGGGTVYCIRRLAPPGESLDLAEEVGHVLGPTIAIVLVLTTSAWASTLWAAALLALGTLVLASLAPAGRKHSAAA